MQKQLNCEEDSIQLETSCRKFTGARLSGFVFRNWLVALEDEYSVDIPSEELQELTTVGAVIDYLKTKGVEE